LPSRGQDNTGLQETAGGRCDNIESALPPEAVVRAACRLVASGAGEQRRRNFEAERFAVVRFTTRSNLVGCSTGRSAGFAPRKILSSVMNSRRLIIRSPRRRSRAAYPAPSDRAPWRFLG